MFRGFRGMPSEENLELCILCILRVVLIIEKKNASAKTQIKNGLEAKINCWWSCFYIFKVKSRKMLSLTSLNKLFKMTALDGTVGT